ncbi:hypothetical protein EYZ11_006937 [Aspergillus tanneri]|uniref:Uncharacterized protein n=1 Tax=Aspergillus tanneri TaxID=1220188 RepID=A0A4V3UP35_9EURO|nr:hypothetical protein EYZ11_006937 [Aspergillus tanneri]
MRRWGYLLIELLKNQPLASLPESLLALLQQGLHPLGPLLAPLLELQLLAPLPELPVLLQQWLYPLGVLLAPLLELQLLASLPELLLALLQQGLHPLGPLLALLLELQLLVSLPELPVLLQQWLYPLGVLLAPLLELQFLASLPELLLALLQQDLHHLGPLVAPLLELQLLASPPELLLALLQQGLHPLGSLVAPLLELQLLASLPELPSASGAATPGITPGVPVSTASAGPAPVVPANTTLEVPTTGIAPGVPVSTTPGPALPEVPASTIPRATASGDPAPPAAPTPANPGATSVPRGPIDLQAAYVQKVPFDNTGQFVTADGEVDHSLDTDSAYDSDEDAVDADDAEMRDVGDEQSLKLDLKTRIKFLNIMARCAWSDVSPATSNLTTSRQMGAEISGKSKSGTPKRGLGVPARRGLRNRAAEVAPVS